VLVTVLKLLLPDMTQGVRTQVVSAIDWDMDYQTMLTNLGSAITSDTVEEAWARLRGREPEPVAVLITSTPTPSPTATPAPTPAPTLEPTPTPTPDPVPERVRQAVDAFLEAQSDFADYDLPATVSYDYLEIPFEYAAPVSGYTSSGFGYRLHPVEDIVKFHYGTDYAVNSGTDLLSFADGTVTEVNWDNGYGNYIRISHDGGWSTLYAHCSQTFVQAGQSVTKGEKIALAGATGEVTGPHLHFELLHDGIYTNPEFFF
jgi:murein DD-endopeptidase MepM/ murein hydrolase activator NlpD